MISNLTDFTLRAQLLNNVASNAGALEAQALMIGEFQQIAAIRRFIQVKNSPIFEADGVRLG